MYYEVCIYNDELDKNYYYKYCDTTEIFCDINDRAIIKSIFLVDCEGLHINITDLIFNLYKQEF